MKPFLIPAVLALTLLSPLAQAENYVGLNVGRSEQQFNTAPKFDDHAAAWKLYGGYNFTRNIGVEAGFAAHGKAELGYATSRASSLYVAATATLPLTEQFSLSGKVGVADNRTKFDYVEFGNTGTYAQAHGMAGVGASYKFAPSLSAVVEYEHFGKAVRQYGYNMKLNTVSVGVRKSF